MELDLVKIYEEYKHKALDKATFLKIFLSIVEEHEEEAYRLKAIDLLNELAFKDKELYSFFERLILTDVNEQIRNAALNYICNNFSGKAINLIKWVLECESSYRCKITLLQALKKKNAPDSKNLLINFIKKIKKVKFLNQEKHYENHKYRKVLKRFLKAGNLDQLNPIILADIIINYFTIENLIKSFPNVYFELNPQYAVIEQLDLSDTLEYEVRGTPFGWKNNIDNLSKIEGLTNLTSLKTLDLSNNLIKDVKEISYLPNLVRLKLMNNKISDIQNLVLFNSMQNLRYLNLEGNPICKKLSLSDFNDEIDVILSNKLLELETKWSDRINIS